MKSKSAGKVKLTSFDDLFGTGEAAAGETVTSVPLSQLHTFKGHPFRVLDDEKMQETVESVKRYGVLMPGIVRPHPAGGYEVIAGHRRWRACELAGLAEMPVIIREMDDDTAVVLMVDYHIHGDLRSVYHTGIIYGRGIFVLWFERTFQQHDHGRPEEAEKPERPDTRYARFR